MKLLLDRLPPEKFVIYSFVKEKKTISLKNLLKTLKLAFSQTAVQFFQLIVNL